MAGRNKRNFTVSFSLDLFTEGLVSLPVVLLRTYSRMGLTELQMMVLIHMINLYQQKRSSVRLEDIQPYMSVSWEEIKKATAELIEKGFITVQEKSKKSSNGKETYTLYGLFDQLAELWVVRTVENEEPEFKGDTSDKSREKSEEAIGKLCSLFESEFGRLLSPMEYTQIAEWYYGEGYSEELIAESLKRAVLRGVLNFKYVDSILREWNKNKIKTVKDVAEYETRFSERRKKDKAKPIFKADNKNKPELERKKKKYKDIYMN